MKIYAMTQSEEQAKGAKALRDQLVKWYKRQAELKLGLATTTEAKRDIDRYVAQATTYTVVAAELSELEFALPGEHIPVGIVL